MTVAILKNGREGDVFGFMMGFCSDGNLGETGFPGDPQFNQVTFPQTEAGAGAPCTKFQPMVTSSSCFISVNGLTAGDSLCLQDANGSTVCVPMNQVGGVAQRVQSPNPAISVLVGVAVDTTVCNGNGYWTRGPANAQIAMPGRVILYHELVGHAKHHCDGDFNASDPEGQAIAEENILRGLQGLETRTSHEGGCLGGGGGGGCFIAGAAYGSQAATEVQALRTVRDSFFRSTSWGENFFDELYRHYYAISPPLAARIAGDPELQSLVRMALVEPWAIALKLFLALPADHADAASAVAFTDLAANEYARWAEGMPLAAAAPEGDRAVQEMVEFLRNFPNREVRSAMLRSLRKDGFLPLEEPTQAILTQLAALQLSQTDLDLLLSKSLS